IFDIPGVGGSPLPRLPYRPSTVARWAAGLMRQLGSDRIDVAGVSWGGGIARGDHGPGQIVGAPEDGEPAPLHRPGLSALDRSGNLRGKSSRGSKPHSWARGKHEGGLEHRLFLPTAGSGGLDESLLVA